MIAVFLVAAVGSCAGFLLGRVARASRIQSVFMAGFECGETAEADAWERAFTDAAPRSIP